MIFDKVQRAAQFHSLHPNIALALKACADDELCGRAPGRYELRGKDVFALIQEYETKRPEDCKYEAHRSYIDVQYILSGRELMGWAELKTLDVVKPYDEEKDFLLLEGKGTLIPMNTGDFAILYPHDAHMPCVAHDAPSKVRKLVLKVKVPS
jgi:biofilm protein TabA